MKKYSSFSRPRNVAVFHPVCGYSNFNDIAEDIVVENTATGEAKPEVLVKHALVAVEGSFKDSEGRPHDFSTDRLSTIADHTNKALDLGVTIPVCTDHKKEFDKTVGGLGDSAKAYTKVIEEQDLPNPRAKHLLGKVGLFLDDVVIKAKHAIDQVKQGVVTSVSMGLNLDPQDHRIVELSLVPIPAIPNMGLFAFGMNSIGEGNAFTWEELETSEQSLDDLRDEYDDLSENLWRLLYNIYTSESADITDMLTLKQYVYTAINGFGIRVIDMLGLTEIEAQSGGAGMPDAASLNAEQQQMMQQAMIQDAQQNNPQQALYSTPKKGLLTFAKYNKAAIKYF